MFGLLLGAAAFFAAATPSAAALSVFAAVALVLSVIAFFSAWHGCMAAVVAITLLPQPFSVTIAGATVTVGRFILFVTLVGWFVQRRRPDLLSRPHSTPLDLFMLMVTATLLLSTISNLPRVSSVDLGAQLRKIGVFAVDFFIFYRVVFAVLYTRERALRFLRFVTGLIAVTAVLGLVERASGRNIFEQLSPILPSRVNQNISELAEAANLHRGSISRLHSTFEQPLIFAVVLLLGIPLAMAFMFAARQLRARVLWGLSATAMATALLFTASRGAYLVLGTMMITMILLAPRGRVRISILVAAALLVAGASTSRDLRTTMVDYLSTTARGSRLEGSLQSRVDAFVLTSDLLSDRPFLGYGPGSFAPGSATSSRVISHVLDDAYLEHTGETGAVGILALVGLLFASFVMAVRFKRRATTYEDALVGLAFIAAIQAWILFSFFADVYVFNAPPRLFFALLAALAVLRASQTADSGGSARDTIEGGYQWDDQFGLVKARTHDVAAGTAHAGAFVR